MAFREYNIIRNSRDHAELNSDEVIENCFEVIRESAAVIKKGYISGMGISSQGEAFTLIDGKGNSLCNAFVSSDSRAKKYVTNWTERFGSKRLYHITGHTAHPMFSLFKLLWVKENMPDIWSKVHKILCFEDLLQFRLGIKDPAMGWSLAGRTMLFDVLNHCWSQEILDAAGIKIEKLSRPLKSGSVIGNIDNQVAKSLNLSEKTFIVTGGHDQVCSALGSGTVEPGTAAYTTGTVDCVTITLEDPLFSESLFKGNYCTYDHAIPGKYATIAFSLTGGNLLKWFSDEFGIKEKEIAKIENLDPYELLLQEMPTEPSNLLVLPYFTPSGTPYFDSSVKGAITGLDLTSTRQEILKALLEGVVLEIKLNLELLDQEGYKVNVLTIIGGGSKSTILNQLKASILNRPIIMLDGIEAGCRGVAMLAASADTHQCIPDLVNSWIVPTSTIKPKDHIIYNKKFAEYKKLYPLLKNLTCW